MSLAFPINPTNGQVYPDPAIANLPQFQWNNTSNTWVKLDNSLATETKAGTAEIATQAEVTTGTDNTRMITPLKLKTNLDTRLDHVPMITHGGTAFPATRPDGTSNQPGDLWWNLDPDIVGYPEGLYVFAQSSTLGPNPGPATSWKRINA